MKYKIEMKGMIASIALALITVYVFATYTISGPEIVIRNFVESLAFQEYETENNLNYFTTSNDASIPFLVKKISTLCYSSGFPEMRFLKNIKKNELEFISLIFQFPDLSKIQTVWVLRKNHNAQWKIDPKRTAIIWRSQLGLL
jgi:hypothetical protein